MKKIYMLLAAMLLMVITSCGGGGSDPIPAPPSTLKAITAFSLAGVVGTINETGKTIAVPMPFGTDVTALVAIFTTTGASVKVGSTVQISGTTANNFTSPVIYTVTASNATTQDYTVTITAVTFVTAWGSSGTGNGQFSYPIGITVDASGNVYVTDYSNNRIQKFSSSGNFITMWGSYGTGNGQFWHPTDIAVDVSGNVYVMDQANYRIQKFSSSGNFITMWGSQGTGNGQFIEAYGVAVDASGNVYVTDYSRIQKFDSSGNFIIAWGALGTGNGQFSDPRGIAVDASGNVYVADTSNNRIQVFAQQ